MNKTEIFYLVVSVICLGSWMMFAAYAKYGKGKIKCFQRKKKEEKIG